ncbi:TIR-like protein FxsC [Micromonospora sp. NPDC049679]|uniref:TIR-like protein FxsC n=1 Tax=Micromonospora sp. NPDC049679 TaxID=3155920 RepID=UPI0033D4117B
MLYFFLSYARGDDDVYVKKFFDELSKEVRNLTGDPSDHDVGFLDVRGIPLGSSWSPQLITALSTCRVFISLCSPSYFRRPACGKEWQVFASRLTLHQRVSGVHAPALMPLVWTPTSHMPQLASRLQYHTDSLGEAYRKDGLRQLVRLNRRVPLLRLVSDLAKKIVETAQQYRLPGPGPVPAFDEIINAFTPDARAPLELSHSAAGSRYVHFVVAAPTRAQVGTVRRNRVFYGDTYADWAPFRPSLYDPIAAYARGIAERQRFGSEVSGIEDLPARIDRANENNQIVVLLVDAWATRLTEHREVLRSYDQRNEPTTGVLIPLPRADEETDAHRSELVRELHQALANNNIRGDTLFRPGIQTHDDFDLELQDVLEEAQNRIYRRGRVRRLPPGDPPGERPILEGPQ